MSAPSPQGRDRREYARVAVSVPVRWQALDEEDAREVRESLMEAPTVWAPTDEPRLREIAARREEPAASVLARAVLELAEEVARHRRSLADGSGPMKAGTLVELSGGGGALDLAPVPECGRLIDLRLDDAPGVRVLAEIVGPPRESRIGFRFVAVHPQDHDRIIRYVYRIQRESLRSRHVE